LYSSPGANCWRINASILSRLRACHSENLPRRPDFFFSMVPPFLSADCTAQQNNEGRRTGFAIRLRPTSLGRTGMSAPRTRSARILLRRRFPYWGRCPPWYGAGFTIVEVGVFTCQQKCAGALRRVGIDYLLDGQDRTRRRNADVVPHGALPGRERSESKRG